MKFNLKKLLKTIKLNEENISMVLGALVIVIVGVLIVNYFKDKNSGVITDSSTQATMSQNEHIVTQGESLWSVAEDSYGSGYNWVDLKSANNLTSDSLEIGQKLIIPNDVEAKTPTVTAKAEVTDLTSITADTYTVSEGDCLWDIAVRAYGDGFVWTEIARVNNLDNPNIIHTGNILILPR